MGVRAALVIGLTLIAIAVVLVLSGSPSRVVGTSSAQLRTRVGFVHGHAHVCQDNEVLPSGTAAVRLGLEAVVGPSMTVTAQSGGRVLTRGARGSGWIGADVTVPVEQVAHTTPHMTLCFALGQTREAIAMLGERGPPSLAASSDGEPALGRIRVEYLAAGDRSWWSQALSVARRIGLGRGLSGTWIVLVIGALIAAVAALASWVSVRELSAPAREDEHAEDAAAGRAARITRLLRRVPAAAWACALVACLNAVCWSLISPPFQVPDEPSHFAYVQQLAEAQRLPAGSTDEFSPEEEAALAGLHHYYIQFLPSARTIASRAGEQKLERDLAQPLLRTGPGDAGTAANEPPLYYALETIPYEIGSGGTVLDRLQLMRLLSALFAGITALFAFMFVRETLPAIPWAWTVGGLGVALAPLLGFISGAVNPDSMLFAVSATLFYLLARAFRRRLTPRLAAAIGVVIVIGLFTKLNFLGVVPGALLGLLALALRAPPAARRTTYIALAVALAISASPILLYLAFFPLVNHASETLVSRASSAAIQAGSVPSELSYVWQFYLPRLPGMTNYFPGVLTTRQLWFNGLVGLYGWADTVFPGWVYSIALIPVGLLGLLAVRALVACRTALRSRAVELAVYAVMSIGVMTLVGVASYSNDALSDLGPFSEPRYLLPMLPLAGAALALAARGAGRRWGPVAGVLIVALILGYNIFSQLLVVSRYYG